MAKKAAKDAKLAAKKVAKEHQKSGKVVSIKSAKGAKKTAGKNTPAKVKSVRVAAHTAKARPTKVKGGTKTATRAAARSRK